MAESQLMDMSTSTDERDGPEKKASKRGAHSNSGWWWLPIGRMASCHDCEKQLGPPEKVAYSYPTKKIYCPDCAQKRQIAEMCVPSRKLQKMAEPGSVKA
jgi:hypothetical protein